MESRLLAILLVSIVLAASGCVSTHMKKFIGQDVRYIEVEDGAPVKVIDLPDGQRAFQYLWAAAGTLSRRPLHRRDRFSLLATRPITPRRRWRPAVLSSTIQVA